MNALVAAAAAVAHPAVGGQERLADVAPFVVLDLEWRCWIVPTPDEAGRRDPAGAGSQGRPVAEAALGACRYEWRAAGGRLAVWRHGREIRAAVDGRPLPGSQPTLLSAMRMAMAEANRTRRAG